MHASQVAAVLAFALGVAAVPRGGHHRSGRPTASFPWASGTGLAFPTGTGLAPSAGFPAPTGFSTVSLSLSNKKASDEDEDEDEDSKSTSSKKSKSTKTKSSKSTKTSSSSSESTEESSGSTVSSGSSSNSTSSGATTTAPATLSGGSSSSGGSIPASSGSSALAAVQTIASGESFDGGMFVYDRGTSCTGQSEGGDSDAVFQIENGGSLSNVIIGPNQIEGVHCQGACTLKNVWWSAVCEDAFTIKNQASGETTNIIGGGAFGAEDKVLQHNGGGSLSVSGFTVDNFGKLYRSCGNCKTQYERHVVFDDITASEGSILAGINSNLGDTATFTNIKVSGVETICEDFTGTDDNDVEPAKVGSGPSAACIYSTSDITGS